MQITRIKEHIGATVTGIDLRQPVDAATRKQLNDAVAEHVVLIIRDQQFTPAQYQAAAELFGELMEDQNRRYLVDGHPLISVLSNRHKDSQGGQAKVYKNATWHTDHTNKERPPKFTMLYPVALPDKGGATTVCNMHAAYEELPDSLKHKLEGRTATHDFEKFWEVMRTRPGSPRSKLTEEQRQKLLETIPVHRFCEPEEVAHVAAFLASPRSGFITGEIVDINGGLHLD